MRLGLPATMVSIALLVYHLVFSDVRADPIVIANIVDKQRRMTSLQVKELYLMKQHYWSDGSKVILCRLPKGNTIHRLFIRDVLRMSPEQYEIEWGKLMKLYGRNMKIINTEESLLDCVRDNIGAIGYTDSDHLVIFNFSDAQLQRMTIVE